jgi:aspartyl-tRNA(Asn)/glutamyl-tRNA(Gln) amidotransferase subunit B
MAHPFSYEIVIGLEVHAQLLTKTKLFCADTTEFGLPPNTSVSAISLGHPGTLPKLNKEAIELAIRLGIATHCTIVKHNYFARKNYFYPDLPKGYQVSQHTTPICKEGFLDIAVGDDQKKIRINRIHMEEDAGKSIHDADSEFTSVDFNRAGIPLVEIVTEPDMRSADEAAAYLTKLRSLVRHLNVCDGNMEQGSFRCDVNISVRKQGDQKLGTKVEIKNLNSIRFMKKAVEFETGEMIGKLEAGEKILQQTKGFDERSGTTYTIRIKEDEDDYRYFPEPDLPPFSIDDEWITRIKSEMPPLQEDIKKQLLSDYNLSAYDANMIAADASITDYFFAIVAETKNYKSAANWIIGPVRNYCDANTIELEELTMTPSSIASLINLVDAGTINYGTATQKIFPALAEDPALDINKYIVENNLQLQSGDETDKLIDAALTKHAEKITEYKKGKKGLLSLFVGEVMKLSKGKADAKLVTDKIVEKLKG